jgi:hypothetical protein
MPGGSYVLNFGVQWTCDDFPQNSAPGRIELVNGGGATVAQVVASVYRPGNISISVSGAGSVGNTNTWISTYTPNGEPADGQLTGTWTISGVAPGNYTLRFYSYTTWETTLLATEVWTTTYFAGGYAPVTNQAPTISWNATPGTVASGQSYTISAHGHDSDGNLTQVNVWRDGSPYAFAGGGNGFDGDSGNSSTDSGPLTITYTAQAVDSNGATSAMITQTVTVGAANIAPTVTWTSSPGSVANAQSYTISAHGHDADGNLTQVNIWKDGAPFAFGGGGNGTDADTGNATSDGGPATIVFTANAVDSAGATSSTISQTVSVAAPAPSVSASIGASPTAATAPGFTTITWSSANASSVVVSGPGISSAAANGSQTVTGLAAGTYTYTITAQGNGGPATQSAVVTVTAVAIPPVSASIEVSPTTASEPGSTTVTWSSANATSVVVIGNGLNSTAANGSQNIAGLWAGSYDYTITAQGPNGPATQTVTFTVADSASLSAVINASPTSATAPGSTTISWSSTNATSVSVSGNGLTSAAPGGSQMVSGLAVGTYDYTITAQGPDGTATQTVNFTVTSAASVGGSISASPSSATEPGSTAISWSTSNASSVSVSGPGLNSSAGSGTQNVSGLSAGTHTYTLTAQGPGGPITRTATFTVNSAPAAVSGAISASPTTATAPGATTISWSTANASSVFVSGPGLASTAASGTQNVTGLAAGTHTFTLTAQGSGGPITRTANVTVTAGAGVTASISVSPMTMNAGGTATLTWSTANATSVRVTGYGISGSAFQTNPNLTITLGGLPPGQSTWTLVAEGAGGPITRTATITVNSTDGLYGSLTVSPTVIYSNQTAMLAWTSSGADFKWVHGHLPGYNGVSVYPAPTSGSTVVSGLAPGDYSYIFEYGPGAFSATRAAFAYLTVIGVDRTVATSVSPAGAGAVNGAGTYREGASVTLNAIPDATHVFTGWSGDLSGTANPLTFTVGAQNYSVVANFAAVTHTVAASVTPAGAGNVSGAGSYNVGATATLTATPDATHAFTGWAGDFSSSANPLTFVVVGNASVVANFAATSFALTTVAGTGGTVTPGGTYPAGTVVTLTATPDSTHRFFDWSGDASGSVATTAITLDRAKVAQANFTSRTSQTITFDPPGDHGLTSPPFTLNASASSGLPVSFTLLGGPAILTGDSVQVTGTGTVTLQANQPGDAFFLPAAPVNQSLNVIAAPTVKYRGQSRTLLRDENAREAPPFVLETP